MKKVYIIISLFIATLFLLVTVFQNASTIILSTYNILLVEENGESSFNSEEILNELEEEVNEHGSTVLKNSSLNDSIISFYQFGKGIALDEINTTKDFDKTNTPISGNYYLTDNNYTVSELTSFFENYGNTTHPFPTSNYISIVLRYLWGFVLYGLAIVLLVFVSTDILEKVNHMKNGGIELISGKSSISIALVALKEDIAYILIGLLISSLLGLFVLFITQQWNIILIKFLLTGLCMYSFILMIISFIVIVIYYIGLKTSNLLLIIKGKSPVRRILGVILIC